ncbi:MAG: Uma2 family endonuclease [Acidobacteria bacterium]|nr:Uma2 family endonuclease [Acidobacteriota bacterium]
MSTSTKLMTAEELRKLPKDGFRYELVEGELKQMSPSGTEHGAVIFNLSILLGQHLKANNLGQGFGAETGFKIDSNPDTVRAPDIAFVRRERIPPTGIPKNFWEIAPDLVVEVVSPGDTFEEVEEKVAQWLAAGTSAVWVVNPKRRSVSVYRSMTDVERLSEADELEGREVVPGFRCKVSEIFV